MTPYRWDLANKSKWRETIIGTKTWDCETGTRSRQQHQAVQKISSEPQLANVCEEPEEGKETECEKVV